MPQDDPTTITGSAGTTPAPTSAATGPDPLATSRQMREQGTDLNQVDWMAKYNGAVGAFNQRLSALTEENERLKVQVADLASQVTQRDTAYASVKTQADSLPTIQQQLTDAQKASNDAQGLIEKQKLLMEFPNLLTAPVEAGKSNPFVELVMGSTLPSDKLREQLAAMGSLMPQKSAANPATGGSPPPAPPASTGGSDKASYRKQAMDWHQKFIDSGRTDLEASAKEQEAWDLYGKAQQ